MYEEQQNYTVHSHCGQEETKSPSASWKIALYNMFKAEYSLVFNHKYANSTIVVQWQLINNAGGYLIIKHTQNSLNLSVLILGLV